LSDEVFRQRPGLKRYGGRSVVIGVRPEDLNVASPEGSDVVLVGDVELVEALGAELLVHFSLDAPIVSADGPRVNVAEASSDDDEPGRQVDCVARVEPRHVVRIGERAKFSITPERIEFFDLDTGQSIWD
jgi:multiple sugar transport system ATP-binding protein